MTPKELNHWLSGKWSIERVIYRMFRREMRLRRSGRRRSYLAIPIARTLHLEF